MNVLMAPAHYMLDAVSGGSEYAWSYHLIESMSKIQDIQLFVLTGIVKIPTPLPPNVTIISLDRGHVLSRSLAYQLAFTWRYYRAARRILRQHHIDVIHHVLPFGYGHTFNLLAVLGQTERKPLIIGPLQSPHDIAWQSSEEKLYSQDIRESVATKVLNVVMWRGLRLSQSLLNRLSRRTLRHASRLVYVNEHARSLYAQQAPNVPGLVIPPGITVSSSHSLAVRKEQDLTSCSNTPLSILFVGWLIRRKGVDILIRAVQRLVGEGLNIRLVIVGDGPQRQALGALVSQQDLQQSVTFAGRVSNADINPYYAEADVFVSMSYSESFGQALLEAMRAGLPVVSAANVGSREIVTDGVDGFLVSPGNVDSLVERLRTLASDPNMRAELGRQARATVEQRYDWDKIAARYVELYREALRYRD